MGSMRNPAKTDMQTDIPSRSAFSSLPTDGRTATGLTSSVLAFAHGGETAYTRWGKRILDLVVSAAGLILVLPFFPLIALAIKRDSPGGPVLYRSVRLGRNGRPFTFYKLRSMVPGAHESPAQVRARSEAPSPVYKRADDPRITRVGRFLRRTSIDELPQLWNVLRGDMTLVGPRPPLPEEVERYDPWQRSRLDVTPGITCLWQVSGRSKLGFDEWMRLDMQYIRNRSFLLDLKILLLTLPAVLSGEGAY
jgi:lipopolysaccharide/colanic/teichoic acid biosynthesis glycosyltransferase